MAETPPPMKFGSSSRLRRLGSWILAGVVVFIVLAATPLSSLSIAIKGSSSASGMSTMTFDATRDPLAIPRPVNVGANTLVYPASVLNVPFESTLRWVPCDCKIAFRVTSVGVTNPLFTRDLPLSRLAAAGGMPTVALTSAAAEVHSDPGVQLQPRVDIGLNLNRFELAIAGILAALAVAITLAVFLLTIGSRELWSRRFRFTQSLDRSFGRLRAALVAEDVADAPLAQIGRSTAPRILLWISILVLAVNVVVLFWGATTVGVWGDEVTHVSRLQDYFATGWYLPNYEMLGGQPVPGIADQYVYGPVAELFSHFVAVLTGADSPTGITTTAAAYVARHVSVAITALVCLFLVAAVVRVVLRSWKWGVIAAAALSAIPYFIGLSMFNPKDVAVACGYTALTLGLCLISQSRTLLSLRRCIGSVAIVGFGTFLMLGTRPGSWPSVPTGFAILIAATVLFAPRVSAVRDRWSRALARGVVALAGVVVGWIGLTLVYPAAFDTPLTLLRKSFSGSADYSVGVHIAAFRGYIPAWILIQIPTVLLIFMVVGLGAGIALCIRRIQHHRLQQPAGVATAVVLVAAQVLLIPLFAFLEHSVLYNGLRQLVFIMPGLAVFFAIGAAFLYRELPGHQFARFARAGRVAVVGVAIVALVLPTIELVMLSPYPADYVTAIGNLVPYSDKLIGRNDLPPLPAIYTQTAGAGLNLSGSKVIQGPADCPYGATNTSMALTTEVADLCGMGRIVGPYLSAKPTSGWVLDEPPWIESVVSGPPAADASLARNCGTVTQITRPTLTGRIVVGALSTCPWRPASISLPAHVSFGGTQGRSYLMLNWSPQAPTGVWSLGSNSGIEMKLPPSSAGALTLTLTGYRFLPPGGSRDLDVLVNGVKLAHTEFDVRGQAKTTVVNIPAAVVASSHDGVLQIQLDTPHPLSSAELEESDSTDPRGYWLESLTLSRAASG